MEIFEGQYCSISEFGKPVWKAIVVAADKFCFQMEAINSSF